MGVQKTVPKKMLLKDIVLKFNLKQIDISLFFAIFERQAKREKIEEKNWVSLLISLLPMDVAQIVVKVPKENSNDFQYVKKVLFNRFKISVKALRNKFENHTKKSEEFWVDLAYELVEYLQN